MKNINTTRLFLWATLLVIFGLLFSNSPIWPEKKARPKTKLVQTKNENIVQIENTLQKEKTFLLIEIEKGLVEVEKQLAILETRKNNFPQLSLQNTTLSDNLLDYREMLNAALKKIEANEDKNWQHFYQNILQVLEEIRHIQIEEIKMEEKDSIPSPPHLSIGLGV